LPAVEINVVGDELSAALIASQIAPATSRNFYLNLIKEKEGMSKTIVLVHGGFVDGSGWEGV